MSEDNDNIVRGIESALQAIDSLFKVLLVSHSKEIIEGNDRESELLIESISKSQEIERLKDRLKKAEMVPFEKEAEKMLKRSKKQLREVK
jgi:Mg2+/Co2+ transporter CorC|tara:strand:- start:48 stop:317 length:270 start_codon:yes stop_codon:yes gene_type:complete